MGVASVAASGISLPATRLVVTPPGEIALCNRLALASRLRLELPEDALHSVLDRQAPAEVLDAGVRPDWERAYSLLRGLRAIDPACGTGDFLLGMLELMEALEGYMARRLGCSHDTAAVLRRICTEQLWGVEVQGATLAEAARRLRARAGVEPHLFLDDSLLPLSERASEALVPNCFDLVVGNPPYVRHEQIADPLFRMPGQAYREAILDGVARRHEPETVESGGGARPGIDRRSDLSALFFLHGVSLLRRDGVLAYVLPSALTQTCYGASVPAVVAAGGREAIAVESVTHRSFADAGVNTSIVLVTPRLPGAPVPEFRRVEIEGRPDGRQAATIWAEVSRQHRHLTVVPRSPDLVPLGRLGRLRYPIKTGLNRFFYPDADTVAAFGIEPRYLWPVLKSPRDVERVSLRSESLRASAFACGDDPENLEPGAAAYVAWGARQRTDGGIWWPDVPSVRGRKHWFALLLPDPADVICPRFFDRRLFLVVPEDAVVEDQTFYGLILAPEYRERREHIAALLTCSLTCLSLELHGRTGLGDGVRQYALCDMAALPVLDPGAVPESLAAPLIKAFRAVAGRPILPVEKEMVQDDRMTLDAVAGEALRVSGRAMQTVRDQVVARVARRASRARSYN